MVNMVSVLPVNNAIKIFANGKLTSFGGREGRMQSVCGITDAKQ